MLWLLAPHQEGLLFSGKMLLEWGVVVSDASVLLFEDIKKLNAQQRTDVPACFIYAPISNLPMTTKHKHFFFLFTPRNIIFWSTHTLFFLQLKPAVNWCVRVCVCVYPFVCERVPVCARVPVYERVCALESLLPSKAGFYWTVEQVWILQLDHISERERQWG